MRVNVSISSREEADYVKLFRYLTDDRELAGRVTMVRGPIRDGEMGGVIEMLTIALGSGGAGAALSHVLAQFVKNQRADIKITVSTPDRVVEVEAARVADAEQILRKALTENR